MTPKEYINSIYKEYENSGERSKRSLSGAINRLQKAFPKRGHFLMEFIQNADDCDSEYLKIVVSNKSVNVYNSGRPFSEKDVTSICEVGQSSKNPEDYIGYLGVGFKSVFLISNAPHVFSGDYKFKFDKNAYSDPKRVPWQVMPIWQEDIPPNTEIKWWKTSFYLPFSFSDEENISKIRNEIETESINGRLLLFLKKLRQIEICDECNSSRRVLKKSLLIESSEDHEIYELIEEKNKEESKSRWVLFKEPVEVPENVKIDEMTVEWERQDVKKREIVVAFRLNGEGELIEEKGAAHIGVFSFLPLKEEIQGLKFLIQGDFLTAPGRETLSRKALWNEWLCSAISNLIINKCIPIFLSDKRWKMNFTGILYSENIQDHFFDINLKQIINEFLSKNAVLIAEDGQHIRVDEAIRLCKEVREIIDEDVITKVLPAKKILHDNCNTEGINIEEGPKDIIGIIEDAKFYKIFEEKALLKDINWFKKYYRKLASIYAADNNIINRIKNEDFIITEDYKLFDINRVLLPTKDIPKDLEHNFKLVNKELIDDVGILNFLKAIGVQEVTDKLIRELMDEKQIPKIAQKWETYSDAEKIEKLRFLFDMWNKRKVNVKGLSFITLKTKDKKWLAPSQIKLGNEFNQVFNLDKVITFVREKMNNCSQETKKSISQKLYNDLNFNFLSPTLMDPQTPFWINFIDELGVNKPTDGEKKSIINKLSVIYALIYEDMKMRKPRELTETEKRGYDIESNEGEVILKIEVKGSENPAPNLWIPSHEFKILVDTLNKTNQSYWVYIIGDVFNIPKIYRLKGESIESEDTGINLEAYKWKKLAKAETI